MHVYLFKGKLSKCDKCISLRVAESLCLDQCGAALLELKLQARMIGKCVGQDAGPARVSAVEALSERLQETKQTRNVLSPE